MNSKGIRLEGGASKTRPSYRMTNPTFTVFRGTTMCYDDAWRTTSELACGEAVNVEMDTRLDREVKHTGGNRQG